MWKTISYHLTKKLHLYKGPYNVMLAFAKMDTPRPPILAGEDGDHLKRHVTRESHDCEIELIGTYNYKTKIELIATTVQ